MTLPDLPQQKLQQLGHALDRLEEVLAMPMDPGLAIRDATIQRFEFVIELFWKALKALLKQEAVTAELPRDILKKAYQAGWLTAAPESLWLQMLQDRNLTSHTYEETLAEKVYQDIRLFYPALRSTYTLLTQQFSS